MAETKKIGDVDSVNTLNASDYIVCVDSNGKPVKIKKIDLINVIKAVASGDWGINITGEANKLKAVDSRSSKKELPSEYDLGLSFDFQLNTADGLLDGGTYHRTITCKGWKDKSGGVVSQLGFTDNGNMYVRHSDKDWIGWGAWKKISFS